MFRDKLIIAFSGISRAGKDRTALEFQKVLKSKHNISSEILSYAQPLKDIVELVYGFSQTEIESKKDYPNMIGKKSIRDIIKEIAIQIRENDDEIFVKLLHKKIEKSNAKIILITDMRFKPEYQMYRKYMNHMHIRILSLSPEEKREKKEYDLDSMIYDQDFNNYRKDPILLQNYVERLAQDMLIVFPEFNFSPITEEKREERCKKFVNFIQRLLILLAILVIAFCYYIDS